MAPFLPNGGTRVFVATLRTSTIVLLLLASSALPGQSSPPDIHAQPSIANQVSSSQIPKLVSSPRLVDFEGMEPATDLARKMLKLDKFVQRDPKDGAAVSQRTEAYLGYTAKSFYAVFLAFDSEPQKIRARMLRRELINDDDQVGMFLDTFHDRRHTYVFYTNPYGIQQDGLFTENQGPDYSWDTVWNTETKITPQGYIALLEIPFKSLRFKQQASNEWGVILARVIPRNSERSYCPAVSGKLQGWLSQEATITGFQEISPGRNMQFMPYTSVGAFRSLDERDPAGDRFSGKHVEPKAGLDSKIVIKDSLVLDTTINPDFGQIESDDPQVTVNQRFEVFFPEKRPFFQENSNFFQTPLNLVFTRRIGDPLYGVRLTGKTGPWAIGTMFANDRSPGHSVIDTDPLTGQDAYFGIVRVNRELGKNNSIGMIYTDRELHTTPNSFCTSLRCDVGFNRVGGIDTQLRFGRNWQMNAQAVTSETKFSDGTRESGPAYQVYAERSSRSLEFNTMYLDIAPGFDTETGFVNRTDYRRFSNFIQRTFHPEGKHLIAHGPRLFQLSLWDHNGTRLTYQLNPGYTWNFPRNSFFAIAGTWEHERLRPVDFSTLTTNR